ncbi:WASH complex subunit 2 isoform X2 [Palaemon carinicauda]|uniref:WASH complex subunit 2 isoform X2 n=1 Tax=Palaemon carinicauda TaxID=392227 RepID=UPI0035B5896B
MGSTKEGSGREDLWWESPTLSPGDLRQHAESWNLGGDAATASLLQNISQRLVSRTHEVEGMLQKVLEETDRVSATIINTSNSFHMLANTQFIENRTYQDDADVAKVNAPAPEAKPPVTEEEVIAQCKAAISCGLDLVNKSYERHEIQDSESEDEDGHESPLPVYALINPYDNQPLPYIIGSQMFMEDNRIGLQDPSSEENSKATLTPDETDTDEESDLESKKNKPIPAKSSKIIDDDSDSDISGQSSDLPSKNPNEPVPQTVSSNEEDDEDDEFFKPSTKPSLKVTRNGPNFTNELNNRFTSTTTAAASTSNNKGFDSESDEDGDLFGSTKPSRGLYEDSQMVKENGRNSSGHSTNSASAGLSRTGVENVRAMPNPIKVKLPQPKRPVPSKSDLFASESEEDDLFSSKSRASSRVSNSSNKLLLPPQPPTPKASSGVFSSDGEDEGELFASQTPALYGDAVPGEEISKSHVVKSSGNKVPVGGVNIFGSAITSALRKQQRPDTDNSEGSDWEDNEKGPSSVKKKEIHDHNNLVHNTEEPLPRHNSVTKVTEAGKSSKGHNLFDDDDDEEDLFGVISKRTVPVSNTGNVSNLNPSFTASPRVSEKATSDKGPQENITNVKSSSQPESKVPVGLFSDDDDDLFSIPVAKGNKPSTVPVSLPYNESPSPHKQGGNKNSGDLPGGISKNNTPTSAINVPVQGKSQPSSLFSSPSDDDLFSPSKTSKTKSVPVVVTEPPPPPASSNGKPHSNIFGSPLSNDDLFASPASVTTDPELKSENAAPVQPGNSSLVENVKEKPPPTQSKGIFSLPSDDDDLFSGPGPVMVKDIIRNSEPPKTTARLAKESKDDKYPTDEVNSVPQKSGNDHLESNEDDLLISNKSGSDNKKTLPGIPPKSESKQNLFAPTEDEDIFFGIDSKSSNQSKASSVVHSKKTEKISLFDSHDSDDDIFTVIPSSTSKVKEDTKSFPVRIPEDEDTCENVKQHSHGQEDTISENEKRLIPPVDNRESPSTLSQNASNTQSLDDVNESNSKSKVDSQKCPESSPVGDGAVFPIKDPEQIVNKQKFTKEESNKTNQEMNRKNDLPKDDIFGLDDSDDDYLFNNANEIPKSSSLISQTSPPPFPDEAETAAESDSKLYVTESIVSSSKPDIVSANSCSKPQEKINTDGARDGKPPEELNGSSVENLAKKDVKGDEKPQGVKEEKPKKKPPVGGVSLFGGGGFGGSELFAKVKQRKSMLAASESDEDEADNTTSLPSSKTNENNISSSRSSLSSSEAFSPTSPISPVMPSSLPSRNTECEVGVNFEDPITSNTVLQSINKTRVKGNKQRRPPSRAHRKGESSVSKSVIAASVPQLDFNVNLGSNVVNIQSSENKKETAPDTTITNIEKNLESLEKISDGVEEEKIKNTKREDDSLIPSTEPSVRKTNAFRDLDEDEDDLFSKPRVASSSKKSSFKEKKSNPLHSSSIFGESISDDDDDLFGASKSRSSSSVNTKIEVSQNVKSSTAKPSAHALFGDVDEDDIFRSSGVDTKPPSSLQKTAPIVKPKSTLKPSSEPFEDPLGSMK